MELMDYKYKCEDALNFMKKIPDGAVKLVITSPPYNIGKEYETKKSIEEYLNNLKPILSELERILADSGSLCWQTGNYIDDGEIYPLDIYFYPIFKELGLKLRNRIIWHFGHGLHCKNRFSGRYETILWFTKGEEYTFNLDAVRVPAKYPGKKYYKGKKKGQYSCNSLGKNPEDVWEMIEARLIDDWDAMVWDIPNVKSNHVEKVEHPCQYPVELVERCVLALTNEGDIVYDPFCGVASSIIAALKNNRIGYGTELEKKYVKIGEDRIKQWKEGVLKTRPIYKEIYKPLAKDKNAIAPNKAEEVDDK